jgi:hypothetical protein
VCPIIARITYRARIEVMTSPAQLASYAVDSPSRARTRR